jgi:hypothetical protein
LELSEARSTARPEPAQTPGGTTESTEQLAPPDGCPRDDGPEVRAEPNLAEQAAAPVVEFSFARLMRDYPHPPGVHSIEHEAYRPHARTAWGKLTAEQKQDAARAVPKAPGKEWLGHWLDSGRETGKFEIFAPPAAVSGATRVWVAQDTPQWVAWVEHDRANGRCRPRTQRCVHGEMQTGWWFESEWPPEVDDAKRSGGAP